MNMPMFIISTVMYRPCSSWLIFHLHYYSLAGDSDCFPPHKVTRLTTQHCLMDERCFTPKRTMTRRCTANKLKESPGSMGHSGTNRSFPQQCGPQTNPREPLKTRGTHPSGPGTGMSFSFRQQHSRAAQLVVSIFEGLREDTIASLQRQLTKPHAGKPHPDTQPHQEGRLCRTVLISSVFYLTKKF